MIRLLISESAKALVRPGSKWNYEVEHQDLGHLPDVDLLFRVNAEVQHFLQLDIVQRLRLRLHVSDDDARLLFVLLVNFLFAKS